MQKVVACPNDVFVAVGVEKNRGSQATRPRLEPRPVKFHPSAFSEKNGANAIVSIRRNRARGILLLKISRTRNAASARKLGNPS